MALEKKAIIPPLFIWGAIVLFLGTSVAFVTLQVAIEKGTRSSLTIGIITGALGLVAWIAAGIAWTSYYPGRKKRQRERQLAQVSCIDEREVPTEESTLKNVALVFLNQESKRYHLKCVMDLVLGNSGLGILFRFEPQQTSGVEGFYYMLGGLAGAFMLEAKSKQQRAANKAASDAAEARRKAELDKTLRERVLGNTKSFVLPLADIVGVRKVLQEESGAVIFELMSGFHEYYFAAGASILNQIQDWLRAAREHHGLSPEDPDKFSRTAIRQWANDPVYPPPANVATELAAIQDRSSLQLSLGQVISLKECKALQRIRTSLPIAGVVRELSIAYKADSAMKIALLGITLFPTSCGIWLAISAAVHDTDMNHNPPLPFLVFGLALMVTMFVSAILLLVGLVSSARVYLESQRGQAN